MEKQDIRWQQRFSNFQKALTQLTIFLEQKNLDKMQEQGLIQAFEYTYELAWLTLKDYLNFQGHKDILGPRDTIQKSFQVGLISNGKAWMEMLRNRNKTAHTYDEKIAAEVLSDIKKIYFDLFNQLNQKLAEFNN